MFKWKKRQFGRILLVLLLVVLCATYIVPYAKTFQAGSGVTSLSIAFKGAGNGLDPQGNRFDINEIKSEEILEKAIKKAGLEGKTTAAEVKTQIYILPQAQSDTLKELLTLASIDGKTQNIGEQIVYPSSFTIGLRDSGIPSVISTQRLLKEITKAYQTYLKAKYLADVSSEPAYGKKEILAMDYPEMTKVLRQESESLLRYINMYAKEDPRFVSETSGMSFGDLTEKAEVLKNNDVANLESLVSYYSLTREPQNRAQYEQTLLKRAGVVAAKLGGAKATAGEIVAIYDNNSNYVFASQDTGSVDVAPLENQFFSDLMQTLVDKQTAYIEAKYEEKDILRNIEKLQALEITSDQYAKTGKRVKAGTEQALEDIAALKLTAKAMAEENYERNIGSKIQVAGVSYRFNSSGNPVMMYVLLLAIILVGRLVVLHFEGEENKISFSGVFGRAKKRVVKRDE